MRFLLISIIFLGLLVLILQSVKKYCEDKAISLLLKAADGGDLTAQATLGDIFRKRKQWDLAFTWYQRAAVNGFSLARYNLGLLYYSRLGIPETMSVEESRYQALKWVLLGVSPDIPYIETSINRIQSEMHPEAIEKAWQETRSIRDAELKKMELGVGKRG